ncbi:MAG: hypothetical protein K0R48_961 [Gammaproteobacteria bacterium]|jgi:hypothetical protein|nr:hypothetical protein [Gammaproteobacteria bacterium]
MNLIIRAKPVFTQTGALLLEIIVTLALSLIVMTVIMNILINSIEQSRYQSNLFSLQRQFSRVSNLFYYELSSAGYRGCLRVTSDEAVQIRKAEEVPATWLGKGYAAKAHTMVIHIQKMATWHDYLLSDHATKQNQWVLSMHQRLKVGDTVVIADCKEVQLTAVLTTSVQKNQQIITTTNNDTAFAAGSYFGVWEEKTFFIAKTDRKTRLGAPIWGLYSYENGHTYEWADGVDDLQFNKMTDNQNHTVLVTHILLKSLERVTHRAQQYFFAGISYGNEDGHLYQGMEVDIPLQPEVP